ncbi:MAG: GNAT family N-acetyltransferase [Elusimicrobiota bacterium]|nr:GNAT family N-acetyltransferase [Elusimicrobiota bacterium]
MIRVLVSDELPAAAALAAAALREDPGFSYMYPEDAARRARLPALLRALLRADLAAGGRVAGAFDGDALVGVSSLLPGGTPEPGLAAWLRSVALSPVLFADPAGLLRGAEVARALAPLRPAASPYLRLLAVHPACQGRGVGAALLRDALKDGALYLETFEPSNRAWYAARGLKETAEVRGAQRPPFWTFRT